MHTATENSTCDLELLVNASLLTYAIRKDDAIATTGQKEATLAAWQQAQESVANKKYTISHTIAPKALAGTGETALSAACLTPKDNHSPIVIAFKGTVPTLAQDLQADLYLTATGVADQQYRDAAYKYYQKIRDNNPGRRIIITGHSLAGNLAQDVGVRAYNKNAEKDLLDVRTFNTAPVRNREDEGVFDKPGNEGIKNHFVNYRTQNDFISKNPLMNKKDGKWFGCYGEMITLTDQSAQSTRKLSHKLTTIAAWMPEQLLHQKVDGSPDEREKEKLLGIIELVKYNTLKFISKTATANDRQPVDHKTDTTLFQLLNNTDKKEPSTANLKTILQQTCEIPGVNDGLKESLADLHTMSVNTSLLADRKEIEPSFIQACVDSMLSTMNKLQQFVQQSISANFSHMKGAWQKAEINNNKSPNATNMNHLSSTPSNVNQNTLSKTESVEPVAPIEPEERDQSL